MRRRRGVWLDFAQFAVAVSKQAVDDSAYKITEETADDVAVVMATGGGGLDVMQEASVRCATRASGSDADGAADDDCQHGLVPGVAATGDARSSDNGRGGLRQRYISRLWMPTTLLCAARPIWLSRAAPRRLLRTWLLLP